MSTKVQKTRPRSKAYPAVTLNQAIDFVKRFKDYPMGKPISYDMAAKEFGVGPTTKSFRYTMSSAKQFGLIATSTGLSFTLLEPAYRLVRPTESEPSLKALKIDCFSSAKLYTELLPRFIGKPLPTVETLENLLVNYYQILPAVAEGAAQTFIDSANELGIVQNGVLCLNLEEEENPPTRTAICTNETSADDIEHGAIQPFAAGTGEFATPLNISFGNKRRAMLYMPMDATKEDAEYVRDMISLMFKRVYKVD